VYRETETVYRLICYVYYSWSLLDRLMSRSVSSPRSPHRIHAGAEASAKSRLAVLLLRLRATPFVELRRDARFEAET
jgi:hypothetical protein